jgi:hypothetical protein
MTNTEKKTGYISNPKTVGVKGDKTKISQVKQWFKKHFTKKPSRISPEYISRPPTTIYVQFRPEVYIRKKPRMELDEFFLPEKRSNKLFKILDHPDGPDVLPGTMVY